jgi:hypothetical protein
VGPMLIKENNYKNYKFAGGSDSLCEDIDGNEDMSA